MFTIYCLSSPLENKFHKNMDFSLSYSCMYFFLGLCSFVSIEARIWWDHNDKVPVEHLDEALFILFSQCVFPSDGEASDGI